MQDLQDQLEEVTRSYDLPGRLVQALSYGTGHIHDTFLVTLQDDSRTCRYIYQRINYHVFRDPEKLMENIARVVEHLASKANARGESAPLRLYRCGDGRAFHRTSCGHYWRVYSFVERTMTHDVAHTPALAHEAARAFGRFQAELADLPPPRLHETIPFFHHTPRRVANLERAVAEDRAGRRREVQREIDFVLQRRDITDRLIRLQEEGRLPERITHNDTKINNVLISQWDGRAVCVIDLDTVMPGLVHYDFGDMVRTVVSPAAEDERDLSRVAVRFEYFEALLRGYLEAAAPFLTPEERFHLPFSGVLITLEIGIRFLTDHLEGDVYFKIHRPRHNLDRARAQFRLVECLETEMPRMMDLLHAVERELHLA